MKLPAGRGVWAPRRPRTPGGGCCPSSAYCRSAAWSPRCPASTRVCSRGPRSILLVYLIYIARHVSDVWQGMDSPYPHSSLYLSYYYDMTSARACAPSPRPAVSTAGEWRVSTVSPSWLDTGHWTLTLAGTMMMMMGPDFNFSSHIISPSRSGPPPPPASIDIYC